MSLLDVRPYFPSAEATPSIEAASLSSMAKGMQGSKILQIAYAVHARIKAGERTADFTVGDFSPTEFRVPELLITETTRALTAGQTNYPPADGVPELRQAVQEQTRRELGLDYPIEAFVVGSGARPLLYGAFRCLLDPGEKVVYPVPSWNNKNFCQLVGATPVPIQTSFESNFMPEVEAVRQALPGARLLVLCSPGNPTGTMIREAQLRAICEMIVVENERREAAGERLLYLVFDQVYRNLVFGDVGHATPPSIVPKMARYTIMIDAISKCFAATGLRVGWMVGPPFIARQVKSLMTHVGAWAPRPEQMATAALLQNPEAMSTYLKTHLGGIHQRLTALADGLGSMKANGLPVDLCAPEGASYLSVRFELEGRPGLPDEDAVREYLLQRAGCAVVPFSAFGDTKSKGWFRFSVGAVSMADIEWVLPRLRVALTDAPARS